MALGSLARQLIQSAADYRRPFKQGNVRAAWYESWDDVPKGELPDDTYFGPHHIGRGRVFAIFSYGTPIAWAFENQARWVTPDIRYSQSTTNHQGTVNVATSTYGFYRRTR